MAALSPSALITDQGRRILLRIHGRIYELIQEELRAVVGLAPGPAGLGIGIDGNRLRFGFAEDQQTIELSAEQMHRRIAKALGRRSLTESESRQQTWSPFSPGVR